MDRHFEDLERLEEVADLFRTLREARISIHILIGRRDPAGFSLYWGWPYDPTAWTDALSAPFDASLRNIAPLIDTLTIAYDLRNPLDEERLLEIDAREHYHWPEATCLRINRPWQEQDYCPYTKQWPRMTPISHLQKMANRKQLKPVDNRTHRPLATSIAPNPPAGEYVDTAGSQSKSTMFESTSTLHQLARRAAYKREALGWQRFWAEYTPKLQKLSVLNIRMPQSFDEIGS